jgi:hypothetical protein
MYRTTNIEGEFENGLLACVSNSWATICPGRCRANNETLEDQIVNLWQRAEDLNQRLAAIEFKADAAGIDPWDYAREYGNLCDELAELRIILWEVEANE